jgi:PAS domain S-box-containing protein
MVVSVPGEPRMAGVTEVVQHRLDLLTRVSELLASSLDYEATLRQIGWLAVPELADWCVVYVVDPDGTVTRVSMAYADPMDATLAHALPGADPPRPGETPGVLRIVHSRRPVLIPHIGEADLAWLARGPRHLQLLRLARLRSVLAVPLGARGRCVGVLALATASSGRTYTQADVAVAQELATLCALAFDNARLHRETKDALHDKEESLALLDTLLLAAPDGLAFIDRDLRWVKVNEALAACSGKPVEQLVGHPVMEGALPGSPPLDRLLRRVLDRGEPLVDFELSCGCPPDGPRHHLVSVYPVRKPQGEILGLGMVAVDITARKQAEDALRDSERRYRRLVETANEGVWLIDTEARTTFVNQRMASMLGYEPDEVAGRSALEFAVDPALARSSIERNLAGISEQFDFALRHRDGSTVLALGGTSPVTNARGEIVGALGMFSDITERKRAEAERDRLLSLERAARAEAEAAQRGVALLAGASHILASSLDYDATLRQVAWLAVPELADWCAVFLVESDGTARLGAVAYADPAKAGLAHEVERAHPLLHSPTRVPASVLQTGASELVSEVTDELLEAIAADDQVLRILRSLGLRSKMTVPMIARGRTLGVLMLATAESGRRYGPNDVALAQQLAERCALALDNAVLVGELRRALGVREELLAATSHELRTPLAHIKGFTSSLRQTDVEWDEATRQDFLAEIEREADRLTDLINDLLSMSRLESGAPAAHPRVAASPAALVAAGLDRVRGLLGDARVHVDVASDLPSVVVDAAQFEQVVANLVENAAKYGPADVEIRIVAARVGSTLELAVEDNGPGIPVDDLERVFDKFYRARSTEQTGVPGTGLGLAICRAIVQANGGRIWAENRPSGGTRLVVQLPLEAATRQEPE